MRVLIVDAFSRSEKGRSAYKAFETRVRSKFKELNIQEEGTTEFTLRHFSSLKEFCYDNELTEFSNKAAVKAFDKLDMIFVDGDCSLMPWRKDPHRSLVLVVRTALCADKCLFAAGAGASVVAYVCATGGRRLKVLNGNGEGGALHDFPLMNLRKHRGTSPTSVAEEEVALDWGTGDIFTLDEGGCCWIPHGNVGV
ncbi:unnamed protein product, partial [Discosporangium mesarthrocarpum]